VAAVRNPLEVSQELEYVLSAVFFPYKMLLTYFSFYFFYITVKLPLLSVVLLWPLVINRTEI